MTKETAHYIHRESGDIKEFVKGKQPKGYEFLPPMQRYLDEDGKFHLRVQLEDCVVDISESDVPREALAQEGEIVENGAKQSVEPVTE